MNKPATYDGVFLVCDGCHDAYVHHQGHATQDDLKAAVDKKAVDDGWKLSGAQAFCPSCAKRSIN